MIATFLLIFWCKCTLTYHRDSFVFHTKRFETFHSHRHRWWALTSISNIIFIKQIDKHKQLHVFEWWNEMIFLSSGKTVTPSFYLDWCIEAASSCVICFDFTAIQLITWICILTNKIDGKLQIFVIDCNIWKNDFHNLNLDGFIKVIFQLILVNDVHKSLSLTIDSRRNTELYIYIYVYICLDRKDAK